MGAVAREQTSLSDSVADAIAAHMRLWYAGPSPATGALQSLVHVAEMIASRKPIDVQFPDPVLSELAPYAAGVVQVQ